MPTRPPSPVAEFCRVSFAYAASGQARHRPFRLAGLTFGIAAGEILAVIGPNSVGKTTVIRLLTGVVTPASGEVRL
ncbi:MAG: cyclic peptide transporter, partial [Candidatus Rokuibacteriota bacterium]